MIENAGNATGMHEHIFRSRTIRQERCLPKSRCANAMWFSGKRKKPQHNLEHLDRFMAEHRETLGWIRPQGGMTAFPWLVSGENARPFCQAAAEQGILLAPGDCFDCSITFSTWLRRHRARVPTGFRSPGQIREELAGEVVKQAISISHSIALALDGEIVSTDKRLDPKPD